MVVAKDLIIEILCKLWYNISRLSCCINSLILANARLHIFITIGNRGRTIMIIIGLYLIACVLIPYLVGILLQIIPSLGVLIVLIIGIVMMLSAAAGRNLSRGFSTGLINGILQGFWFCVNLLINTILRVLRWTTRITPRVYRRTRSFFVNQCGMSTGLGLSLIHI